MKICLTPVASEAGTGVTHAYLPALAACCGIREYLAALYRGNIRGVGWQQIADFADRYLPQPDFDRETVRVLFEAFRHPVAHRGIASGVWVDRNHGAGKGRRLTWKVSADAKRPACEVVAEVGRERILCRHSPRNWCEALWPGNDHQRRLPARNCIWGPDAGRDIHVCL